MSITSVWHPLNLYVQEELLSIRKKFDDGDAVEHLSKKLNKTRAKRVRERKSTYLSNVHVHACM